MTKVLLDLRQTDVGSLGPNRHRDEDVLRCPYEKKSVCQHKEWQRGKETDLWDMNDISTVKSFN